MPMKSPVFRLVLNLIKGFFLFINKKLNKSFKVGNNRIWGSWRIRTNTTNWRDKKHIMKKARRKNKQERLKLLWKRTQIGELETLNLRKDHKKKFKTKNLNAILTKKARQIGKSWNYLGKDIDRRLKNVRFKKGAS